MATTVILGPPGTGKTTTALRIVSEHLAKGVPPNQIAYLTFTVKAANEARDRAMEKFSYTKADLPWFRTLHALSFKWLGMSTSDLVKKEHYSQLCQKLGLEYSGYVVLEEGLTLPGGMAGDRMLFHEGLARVRMITPEQQLRHVTDDFDGDEFIRLCTALREFKKSFGLIDFNDMLYEMLKLDKLPSFKLLVIDEAQDLSKLQWELVNRLISNSEVSYVAGDDDQAIYRWAGADTESFIGCPGDVIQLEKSYRLPRAVHDRASSLIRGISHRRQKRFEPADHGGAVHYITGTEELDLSSGQWLFLARNAYLLNGAERQCEEDGHLYAGRNSPLKPDIVAAIKGYEDIRKGREVSAEQITSIKKFVPQFTPRADMPIWHEAFKRLGADDRDYFISCMRKGESLLKPPRITLSTIHGAKGGEADNVVLFTDMSYKSYEEFLVNPDDEIRVFYVAATRAKKNLYIVEPQTQNAFNLL